ncbi:MAG: mechanosensitive ion channel domain-containing protein [Halobacteriaceae archaeon]
MVAVEDLLGPNLRFVLAVGVLILGVVLGFLAGRLSAGLLDRVGVPEAVEGTSFERTARGLGTSTVGLFSTLVAWFVYAMTVVLALQVARLLPVELFWARATGLLPDLFVAVLVLVVGFVVGDKAQLSVGERLSGVKVTEVDALPRAVKYSVVYVAALIALGQVGVATGALLVLLGAYAFAVVVLGGLALRDVLPAATAGVYLLLSEPYGIGDSIVVDGRRGVVQEVDIFVTVVESESEEYVVPNHLVLRQGVRRVRD